MTHHDQNLQCESHPLTPFLPANAKVLMLGSFPPKQERWSMEWFYPNWINDMWRLMGLIFFEDKHHFELSGEKRFDKERITEFCKERGIALYDTASKVRRLKDNASDKYLEVVTPTDIAELLQQLPLCGSIVTTGEKASEIVAHQFQCPIPAVGTRMEISLQGRDLHFWRMPSTSRAYPLSLEKKASAYRRLFIEENIL
ncbi:MAG: uracil-DNA glycosylase family protein [Alistipes sp.]|nr:uracil-DNA glycosylase family protein [Alistipes sp.]